MFQTELNHFLQSFASDGLTTFMRIITALGYPTFLMVFLLVLLFAVNFKKTFLLFLVLLWTIVFTFFFKEYFDLPRPFHVDNTLQFLDGQLPDSATFNFSKRGATTFWGQLPKDVLEVTRQADHLENGFPSGHTSGAIALWGALALLFRNKWVRMICVALMILIPLSRMYLGVHFLADVLGGVLLGVVILGIAQVMIFNSNKLNAYLEKDKYAIGFNATSFFLLVCPFIGFLFLPPKYYLIIAFMLGFGLAFLLLGKEGLPIDEAPLNHKIGRTFLGILFFVLFNYVLKMIAEQIGLGENIAVDFFINLIGCLALIWLGTKISMRLGWFKTNRV